jgi:diadenosine tetraphosphate (Ap4A) HIT family hydrolase
VTGMDVVGCLGCDVVAGRRRVPGGIVHETTSWVVNHVVGSMNLGTLIAGPREHVVAVADLDSAAVVELGPVLRDAARVVEKLCQPDRPRELGTRVEPGRGSLGRGSAEPGFLDHFGQLLQGEFADLAAPHQH